MKPFIAEAGAVESSPIGLKNYDIQHTHITKAIVNIPNFPGELPFESVVFLSRVKLISFSIVAFFCTPLEASLSP